MHHICYRRLVLLVLVTAVVLISRCSEATVSNTPSNDNTPVVPTATATPSPLAEHLIFQGDISGTLATEIDLRPATQDNPTPDLVEQPDGTFFDPAPQWTQCATFDALNTGTLNDYMAVIVGMVGSHRYVVAIEVNMDDPAYTKPGTELHPGNTNSGGSVEVYEDGGQNRRWLQVYGPALQAPVIVLNADRQSGTVDTWMATTGQSMKDATATLHLHGDWRCG